MPKIPLPAYVHVNNYGCLVKDAEHRTVAVIGFTFPDAQSFELAHFFAQALNAQSQSTRKARKVEGLTA